VFAGAGVPGPWQTTVAPAGPIDHSMRSNVAVAVTVVGPAVAVTVKGPVAAAPPSTHIHTGKPTADRGFADNRGADARKFNWAIADCATTAGLGAAGAAGFAGFGGLKQAATNAGFAAAAAGSEIGPHRS